MLIDMQAKETGKSKEEVNAEMVEFVSMKTLIEPEEIGDMVVFLSSNSAKHVTGQLISVDENLEWEE